MKNPIITGSLLCLAATAVYAADSEPTESSQTIVVTASRTPQSLTNTLASTTVITRQQIQAQQAQSVQELLSGVAGIEITNNGGAGKVSSLFLRGTESDHLVFLINGVKVGSATLGSTSFQLIPVEEIERIEIVRGPMSSLYGSEAIGGVVQIFTRDATGPITPTISASVGSNATQKVSAGVSGRHDNSWFSVGISHEQSDGFDACAAESATGFGCITDEPDNDGYRNESVSLRAGHAFDEIATIEFNGLRSEGDVHFDGGFSPFYFVPNESDFVQQSLGLTLGYTPNELWKSTLTVGESRDESDNRQSVDGSTSFFDTRRHSVNWQNDLFINAQQIVTVGLDYQNDEIASNTAYPVTERDNIAAFAQVQANVGAQDLQVALRHDDNEQFGGHTTGNIAWGFMTANKLRYTASLGTAFKAPTFNELYFPFFGNPDLDPEQSKSFELGVRQSRTNSHWSAALFATKIDDLIAYDPDISLPNNVSEARIVGLETAARRQMGDWQLAGNLTLQKPENRDGGANHGNQLVRRAEQSLRIDADRTLGELRYGLTFRAVGERFDNLSNTRKLAGYGTVDLRISYDVTRDWQVHASATNVLDKEYETASGYNTGGDQYFLGVRYSPGR